jgi:hypothetical protein
MFSMTYQPWRAHNEETGAPPWRLAWRREREEGFNPHAQQ